jgi:nucleolar pre-ribosomal-associated protein 1
MEKELRRRVPDFQVVVAFAQQTATEGPTATGRQPNAIRNAMLSECAQRLLWLYHRCLPLLVAEARFDVGKLLQNFITNADPTESTVVDQGNSDGEMAFRTVRQLHVLRLLKESDQFVWSAKPRKHCFPCL